MFDNLAQLLLARSTQVPQHRYGMATGPLAIAELVELAADAASAFNAAGLGPGRVAAVLGANSNEYLVTWAALQLAGVEAALINPTYPSDLLTQMIADLQPDAVVTVGPTPAVDLPDSDILEIDTSALARRELVIGGRSFTLTGAAAEPVGVTRKRSDIAGYMHTSGTTGNPKFCAQSHDYFLRLGRYVADSMCLGRTDVVYAPLPLFHINPLGYGAIGALTAGAQFMSTERFSASGFWPEIRRAGVTAMILHAPPVEILKRATTGNDAADHNVRAMFYTDPAFLDVYGVPVGLSAYGSTEAAGLTHMNVWRRGDAITAAEGASHVAGHPRSDVECRVSESGEIEVRGSAPHVLFEGYRIAGHMTYPFDSDGWFKTGDRGRLDEDGKLVFVERLSEAVRVKGEYVPLSHVESLIAKVPGIDEVSLWKVSDGPLGDRLVAYVVAQDVDKAAVQSAAAALPPFMRPSALIRLASLPRDGGVGKVRRRQLADIEALDVIDL